MMTSGAGQFSGSNVTSVLWYGFLLILACAALWAAIWFLRRRLFSAGPAARSEIFTLQHLREMREKGHITEQEFETLKARHLAEMGCAAAARPKPGPTGTDAEAADGRE